MFAACKHDTGKFHNKLDKPVVNEKGKGSEEFKEFTRKWVMSGFDTKQFKEKKAIDASGEKVLIDALNKMIGSAYYDLKSDGTYVSGDSERSSKGTWGFHRTKNELHFLESKETNLVTPVVFKVSEIGKDKMVLIDPDHLKIIFEPASSE